MEEKGSLKRRIHVLGGLNLACLLIQSVLSYALTPVAPLGTIHPREAAVFAGLADRVVFLGPKVQQLLRGHGPFSDNWAFAAAYCIPLLLSSGIFVLALSTISRRRDELPRNTPWLLAAWAVGFAVVCLPASPFIVQDFWLSPTWGKMAAAGLNPYHSDLPQAMADGMPFDSFGQRMTYGPLWTLISGVLMWSVGGSVLAAAVLFKLLLASCWIGCLGLIFRLLQEQPIWRQSMGLCIFGWLPLSVVQSVAEGHNDIVMAFLTLGWLWSLQQGGGIGGILLLIAASLIKYITAPLLLLDLLFFRFSLKRSFSTYLTRAGAAGVVALLIFGLFYRSPDFFNAALSMRNWHFLEPGTAVQGLAVLLQVDLKSLSVLVRVLLIAIAGYSLLRYVYEPSTKRFYHAILATTCVILFWVVGHVWPWYLIWVIVPASLVADSRLVRWVVGIGVAIPFALVQWIAFPQLGEFDKFLLPALLVYAFSLVWLVVTTWSPRMQLDADHSARRLPTDRYWQHES